MNALALLEFENVRTPWLWVVAIALAIAWLVITYREIAARTTPVAWGLLALRLLGIAALLVALAKPTWTRASYWVDPGRLAVIVDDSLSMSLASSGGKSRYALATSFADRLSAQLENTSSEPRVKIEFFNIDGQPLDAKLPPEPKSERTDLTRAIHQALSQLRSQMILGVILVSDGMDNTGRADLSQIAKIPTPISAVGFPSDPDTNRLNLAVSDVVSPSKAVIVHNEVSVSVKMKKSAGPAVDAQLILMRGTAPITSQSIRFEAGASDQSHELTFTPQDTGRFVYTVALKSDAGEISTADNVKHFPLQVDADPIGVLYLEGSLRYEAKYLKTTLQDDPDLSLVTSFQKATPAGTADASQGVWFETDNLDKFDLVIIGDIEANTFSDVQWQRLVDWVSDGHALLVLGGYRSFGEQGLKTTPLAAALPVVLSETDVEQSEEPFILQLTDSGKNHPIFRVSGDRVKDADYWSSTPQLLGAGLCQRAKPGADVFAVHPHLLIDGKPAVLMAAQHFGKGHTMLVAADTTWRWSRLPRILGQSDTLYYRFWRQTIRWLTGRDMDEERVPLLVTTQQPDYKVGQKVLIQVHSQHENSAAGVGGVEVSVIDEAGQAIPIPVRNRSETPQDWQGNWYPTVGGRYRITAELKEQDKIIANQTAEIIVHGSNLELIDPGTNRALMQSLAQQTGGIYLDIDQADQLLDRLVLKERRLPRMERTEYWNSSILFFVFLGCLSAEWLLRRRQRLI
ncbi:MAG: glutamine amidotransferase [Planctomycetaceae bacterium]